MRHPDDSDADSVMILIEVWVGQMRLEVIGSTYTLRNKQVVNTLPQPSVTPQGNHFEVFLWADNLVDNNAK